MSRNKQTYIRPALKVLVTEMAQVICASNDVDHIDDNLDDDNAKEGDSFMSAPRSSASFWDDDSSDEYDD